MTREERHNLSFNLPPFHRLFSGCCMNCCISFDPCQQQLFPSVAAFVFETGFLSTGNLTQLSVYTCAAGKQVSNGGVFYEEKCSSSSSSDFQDRENEHGAASVVTVQQQKRNPQVKKRRVTSSSRTAGTSRRRHKYVYKYTTRTHTGNISSNLARFWHAAQ